MLINKIFNKSNEAHSADTATSDTDPRIVAQRTCNQYKKPNWSIACTKYMGLNEDKLKGDIESYFPTRPNYCDLFCGFLKKLSENHIYWDLSCGCRNINIYRNTEYFTYSLTFVLPLAPFTPPAMYIKCASFMNNLYDYCDTNYACSIYMCSGNGLVHIPKLLAVWTISMGFLDMLYDFERYIPKIDPYIESGSESDYDYEFDNYDSTNGYDSANNCDSANNEPNNNYDSTNNEPSSNYDFCAGNDSYECVTRVL